jgi:hypothetical protein
LITPADTPASPALYSTKGLELLWLPKSFASTFLSGDKWYFACDLTFLSWMNGLATKNAAKLTKQMTDSINFIRSWIYSENGITDDTPHLIPEPGAKLPPTPDPCHLFDVFAFDWSPALYDMAFKAGRPPGINRREVGELSWPLRTIGPKPPPDTEPEREFSKNLTGTDFAFTIEVRAILDQS